MATRHKLNEVYYGRLYSNRVQEALRARVHWICRQVHGQRILDVGCGQGIVSILLAREGLNVLGVDGEAEAIAYALREREAEPADVQARLSFMRADVTSLSPEDGLFDTVVLDHVLEYLVTPTRILRHCWNLLAPDGRFVITVAHGLVDHADQKTIFYAPSFLRMVLPFSEPLQFEVVGNSLCFVGIRREVVNPDLTLLPSDLACVGEQHLESLQRESARRVAALTSKLKSARDRSSAASHHSQEELRKLQDELAHLRATQQEDLRRIALLHRQLDQVIRQGQKACRERDLLIARLRQRLAMVEQSTKFRLGDLIVTTVSRPWTAPVALWKGLRLFQQSVVRRLRGEKRNLHLAPLPKLPEPPRHAPPLALPTRASDVGAVNGSAPLQEHAVQPQPESVSPSVTLPSIPVQQIPQGPVTRPNLRVAAIMDEFSRMAFQYEFQYIAFGPDDFQQILSRERPDLLLVESAWRGNDGRWRGIIANPTGPKQPLVDLVNWCKERQIPTVFWNKEDPPNFDWFIKAAQLFDYVFTTDENCIPRYKQILGHDRVFVLPFAAQPRIHNPIQVKGGRKYDVAFAGSYYAGKHDERRHQMEVVVKPATKFNLHIYDRNYALGSPNYEWPEEYRQHIVGGVSYEEMLTVYKMYKVFLNVNSVADSPSMCARRIFELLASGTPVVSGYSQAIESMFADVVSIAKTPEETERKLNMLLMSSELRDRRALIGLRRVLQEHTYSHRVDTILRTVGLPVESRKPLVSVVVPTNRTTFLNETFANIARQTYDPIELILVLHGVGVDPNEIRERAHVAGIKRIKVIPVDESKTLGYCLNCGIEAAEGEYLSKMDDDNYYAANFMLDLMNGYKYADAEIIGKLTYYCYLEDTGCLAVRFPGNEYRYTNFLSGSAMVWKREISDHVRFPDQTIGEDTAFLRAAKAQGARLFSTDRFNYVYVRRANSANHSWRVDDEVILSTAKVHYFGNSFDPITV